MSFICLILGLCPFFCVSGSCVEAVPVRHQTVTDVRSLVLATDSVSYSLFHNLNKLNYF